MLVKLWAAWQTLVAMATWKGPSHRTICCWLSICWVEDHSAVSGPQRQSPGGSKGGQLIRPTYDQPCMILLYVSEE